MIDVTVVLLFGLLVGTTSSIVSIGRTVKDHDLFAGRNSRWMLLMIQFIVTRSIIGVSGVFVSDDIFIIIIITTTCRGACFVSGVHNSTGSLMRNNLGRRNCCCGGGGGGCGWERSYLRWNISTTLECISSIILIILLLDAAALLVDVGNGGSVGLCRRSSSTSTSSGG